MRRRDGFLVTAHKARLYAGRPNKQNLRNEPEKGKIFLKTRFFSLMVGDDDGPHAYLFEGYVHVFNLRLPYTQYNIYIHIHIYKICIGRLTNTKRFCYVIHGRGAL